MVNEKITIQDASEVDPNLLRMLDRVHPVRTSLIWRCRNTFHNKGRSHWDQ